MLEVRKKRMVITRKTHECYGCLEEIEKGKSVIYVSAKEDDKHIQFHLHEECNKVIVKDQWFSGSGLYRGFIKDAMKTSEQLRALDISSKNELPLFAGVSDTD
ncbi:hypothetical protein R6U76_19855 [Lysinibacillus capsici]|uniref:hypothetical protein n=1 Tax=Lysinibacillus capsici TaxID=2115968 RepID=UPI0029DE58B2|nr:hypothetical protein [Lysinibacillus capsici]WPK04856.1 hypothetical protein R6U76_19855 [Lysinibacillus capsici]